MSSTAEPLRLEDWVRDIPDFPQQGILFKDITPLLQNGAAFHAAMERLAAHYAGAGIQTVVGVAWLYFWCSTGIHAQLWFRAGQEIR
jgi:adenine phosphoribosyltransferase